jgi:hypothetical protein
MSGASAPGTSGGVLFSTFFHPHINHSGEITFTTNLAGLDVDGLSQVGVWKTTGGSLTKVVRQGDPAPGSLPIPGGQICFSCSNPFPSLANGELFCSVDPIGIPLFNERGDVVFKSELSTITSDTPYPYEPEPYRDGVWRNRNGVISKVVAIGDVMPGGAGPITSFSEYLINFAKVNDHGDLAFTANTASLFGGAYFLRDGAAPGAFETIVTPNTPVDHVAPGTIILGARLEGLNNNRQILFESGLSGPTVDNTNNASLWIKDNAGLHLVAREGDIVPGTSFRLGRTSSPNFSFISAALGGNGTAAFAGQTNSGNGIFTATENGELKLHAYGGMQAPGLAAGVVFNNTLGNGGNIAVNEHGQVAFYANVTGPGIPGSVRSVWVTDRIGDLHLVFLDGQQLEYRPGEFRGLGVGIADGVRSGNQDGDVIALNDLGEVVFTTEWGVFVSTVGTIPEPTSLALLLLGLACCPRRRGI